MVKWSPFADHMVMGGGARGESGGGEGGIRASDLFVAPGSRIPLAIH